MTTREALQTGFSLMSAAGVDGEIATVSPICPQAFVITVPGILSKDSAKSLRDAWEMTFKGTTCERVKVIVLENGMKLEIIDDPKGNLPDA